MFIFAVFAQRLIEKVECSELFELPFWLCSVFTDHMPGVLMTFVIVVILASPQTNNVGTKENS